MWAKFVTFLLDYILARLITFVSELIKKFKRDKTQEEAIKKVEEDIAQKKPRDEEVIKNEQDALNS